MATHDTDIASVAEAPGDSACILDVWESQLGQHDECAMAFSRLCLASPELIDKIGNLEAAEKCLHRTLKKELDTPDEHAGAGAVWCRLGLARIMLMTDRAGDAEKQCVEALELLKDIKLDDRRECLLIDHQLAHLLKEVGRADLARQVRPAVLMSDRTRVSSNESMLELRGVALSFYESRRFAEAEQIYRHLLANDFDTAGTYCHLARVLVATGRDAAAQDAVDRAFALRSGADVYIVGRMLYLKALLLMFANRDATAVLAELKLLVRNDEIHHDWTMRPLVETLQSRLPEETFMLMVALVAVLSSRAALPQLERLAAWQAITPVQPV